MKHLENVVLEPISGASFGELSDDEMYRVVGGQDGGGDGQGKTGGQTGTSTTNNGASDTDWDAVIE